LENFAPRNFWAAYTKRLYNRRYIRANIAVVFPASYALKVRVGVAADSNTFVGMILKAPSSASCRERAAIYARCAEEAASAETASALRYLERMWIVIAEVTDAIEGNGSRSALDREPPNLSAD
jgi:hypothetical protein